MTTDDDDASDEIVEVVVREQHTQRVFDRRRIVHLDTQHSDALMRTRRVTTDVAESTVECHEEPAGSPRLGQHASVALSPSPSSATVSTS